MDQSTNPMHPPQDKYILELGDHDVLCGRGSGPNDRRGNIEFRNLIMLRKVDYLSAPTRDAKGKIAKSIVETVRMRGGRFVRKLNAAEVEKAGFAKGTAVYEMADEPTVLEKAKQTLRQNRADYVTKNQLPINVRAGGAPPTMGEIKSRQQEYQRKQQGSFNPIPLGASANLDSMQRPNLSASAAEQLNLLIASGNSFQNNLHGSGQSTFLTLLQEEEQKALAQQFDQMNQQQGNTLQREMGYVQNSGQYQMQQPNFHRPQNIGSFEFGASAQQYQGASEMDMAGSTAGGGIVPQSQMQTLSGNGNGLYQNQNNVPVGSNPSDLEPDAFRALISQYPESDQAQLLFRYNQIQSQKAALWNVQQAQIMNNSTNSQFAQNHQPISQNQQLAADLPQSHQQMAVPSLNVLQEDAAPSRDAGVSFQGQQTGVYNDAETSLNDLPPGGESANDAAPARRPSRRSTFRTKNAARRTGQRRRDLQSDQAKQAEPIEPVALSGDKESISMSFLTAKKLADTFNESSEISTNSLGFSANFGMVMNQSDIMKSVTSKDLDFLKSVSSKDFNPSRQEPIDEFKSSLNASMLSMMSMSLTESMNVPSSSAAAGDTQEGKEVKVVTGTKLTESMISMGDFGADLLDEDHLPPTEEERNSSSGSRGST